MASSDGPEEEFSDERCKKLLHELGQHIGLTVPPTTWACLWLADIERLQYWQHGGLQRDQKDSPRPASPQLSVPSSDPPTPNSGSPKRKLDEMDIGDLKRRSTITKGLCQKRDHRRCIITRDREIDVAHIYPFSLHGHEKWEVPEDPNIWTSLRYFWSKDRVKAWHDAIFPQGRYIEVCYNLMCLSPSAHRYYRKGYFALKPISLSDDKKCLTVKFFWLCKESRPSNVNLCETPLLEGRDQGPGYARLWNHETTNLIQSGDELPLETEDPENLPLPSWALLEMQWFLNRVVAISGAADIEDDYYDNDDDDDSLLSLDSLEQEQDSDMLDEWNSQDER